MSGAALSLPTGPRRLVQRLLACAGWGDEAGASAAEFALIAPVFCLILVGSIDFGGVLYTKFGLDSAVSAAANYAILNAGSVNSTGGTLLATSLAQVVASGHAANWANATIVVNNGPSATLAGGLIVPGGTASNADSCYCPSGSGANLVWGAAATCGTACSSGGIAGRFVMIAASRAYSPIFSRYGIVGQNATIGASAVVEAQ